MLTSNRRAATNHVEPVCGLCEFRGFKQDIFGTLHLYCCLGQWIRGVQYKEAILIRGARQVGKTTLVRMLADQLDLQ